MLQKENFEIFTTKVYHQLIDRQRLGAALQLIHSHPQFTLVSGEVAEIEADYQRMCDFMLSGYADEHRQTLYYQLLHRAFAVTQRLALSDWLNHPYLRGYAIIADGINLDVEQMRETCNSLSKNSHSYNSKTTMTETNTQKASIVRITH